MTKEINHQREAPHLKKGTIFQASTMPTKVLEIHQSSWHIKHVSGKDSKFIPLLLSLSTVETLSKTTNQQNTSTLGVPVPRQIIDLRTPSPCGSSNDLYTILVENALDGKDCQMRESASFLQKTCLKKDRAKTYTWATRLMSDSPKRNCT